MARNETPPGAEKWVPSHPGGLDELKQAAAQCKGCQLHEDATQTVFGRGAPDARVVFVGEQPGDVEDQQGLPFVGPAGRVLCDAVEEAGIEVPWVYITNAVTLFRRCSMGVKQRAAIGVSLAVPVGSARDGPLL